MEQIQSRDNAKNTLKPDGCYIVGLGTIQMVAPSSLTSAVCTSSQEADPVLSQIEIKLMPKTSPLPILQLSAFKLLPTVVLCP